MRSFLKSYLIHKIRGTQTLIDIDLIIFNVELGDTSLHRNNCDIQKVINLDSSRVKNVVRSGDEAACEGVHKYVEQAARKPMRQD